MQGAVVFEGLPRLGIQASNVKPTAPVKCEHHMSSRICKWEVNSHTRISHKPLMSHTHHTVHLSQVGGKFVLLSQYVLLSQSDQFVLLGQ